MIGSLFFAAALLAAPAAAAQVAGAAAAPLPDFPSRGLREVAADRAEADALIASSGHPDLFVNITLDRGPVIRHRASGMICHYAAHVDVNNLKVYEATPGQEDVSCNTAIDGVVLTHYATQYVPSPTPEDVVRSAIEAIRQTYPPIRPYDGETVTANAEGAGLPQIYVSRMVITINGVDKLTKVALAQTGPWSIMQRMTVRLDDSRQGDLWAETMMVRTLIDVVHPGSAH